MSVIVSMRPRSCNRGANPDDMESLLRKQGFSSADINAAVAAMNQGTGQDGFLGDGALGKVLSFMLNNGIVVLLGAWLAFNLIFLPDPVVRPYSLVNIILVVQCLVFATLIKMFTSMATDNYLDKASSCSWNKALIAGVGFGLLTVFVGLPLFWFISFFAVLVITLMVQIFGLSFEKAIGLYIMLLVVSLPCRFLIATIV